MAGITEEEVVAYMLGLSRKEIGDLTSALQDALGAHPPSLMIRATYGSVEWDLAEPGFAIVLGGIQAGRQHLGLTMIEARDRAESGDPIQLGRELCREDAQRLQARFEAAGGIVVLQEDS